MTAKKTAISSLPKHSEVRKQDEVDRIYDKIIVYGCIPLDRAKAMTEEMTQSKVRIICYTVCCRYFERR